MKIWLSTPSHIFYLLLAVIWSGRRVGVNFWGWLLTYLKMLVFSYINRYECGGHCVPSDNFWGWLLRQILTREFCCYAYFSLIKLLKSALMWNGQRLSGLRLPTFPCRCESQFSPGYELMRACKQGWPTEHEVEDSSPLPSSLDVQAVKKP